MDPKPGEEIFFHGHSSWRSLAGFYVKGLVTSLVVARPADPADRHRRLRHRGRGRLRLSFRGVRDPRGIVHTVDRALHSLRGESATPHAPHADV